MKTIPATAEQCPHCGSRRLSSARCPGGPHFGRVDCRDCGKHVRWERTPMTPERAAAFTLPFGKHKGETLAEVGSTDRRYLEWLASLADLAPSFRRAVVCYLGATR
jgi:hypothetical protein